MPISKIKRDFLSPGGRARLMAEGNARQDKELIGEADLYRAALERAAYGDAGRQYGQGLDQISNYLAGQGPMADSGGATALRARLASQIYGQAAGRIGGSYADYLGSLLNQRRQFNYQKQLLAYQRKMNKKSALGSLGAVVGGVGGALLGGPAGAYAGYQIGTGGGAFGGGGGGGRWQSPPPRYEMY